MNNIILIVMVAVGTIAAVGITQHDRIQTFVNEQTPLQTPVTEQKQEKVCNSVYGSGVRVNPDGTQTKWVNCNDGTIKVISSVVAEIREVDAYSVEVCNKITYMDGTTSLENCRIQPK